MKKILVRAYEYFKRRFRFLKRRFKVPAIPQNSDGKVYVNVGCGLDSGAEFTNVDVLPFPNIHHVRNINDLSIFPKESVDMIYASHVLEHIPRNEMPLTLKEWKRVLKKGGILRISVPDFDNLISVYLAGGRNIDLIRDNVLGQEPPYDNHYTLWNKEKMRSVLEQAGFGNIRTWLPEVVDHHDFKDRSSRKLQAGNGEVLLSLNIEANKQ